MSIDRNTSFSEQSHAFVLQGSELLPQKKVGARGLSAQRAPTSAVSAGKPRTRRFVNRAARREAVNRDIVNLFRLKLAIAYIEDGLSLGQVSRLFGMSASLLCHLRKRYMREGFDAVAPALSEVFPRALEMDVFDPDSAKVCSGADEYGPAVYASA